MQLLNIILQKKGGQLLVLDYLLCKMEHGKYSHRCAKQKKIYKRQT